MYKYMSMMDVSFNWWSLWGIVLGYDLIAYAGAAGVGYFIFWQWKQSRWQHLLIQKTLPEIKRVWYEIKYGLSTVFIFSTMASLTLWALINGHTRMYTPIDALGWPYFVLSIIFILVAHDAYFYWTHRIMHHPEIFKTVHKVHHKSTNPSPWAAYSFHPIEAVIQGGIFPLLAFTVPMYEGIYLFAFFYMIAIDTLVLHIGYEFFPKGFTTNKLTRWYITSTHHNLHHRHVNCNYALYFTWWDVGMRTLSKQYHEVFESIKSRKKLES
jgi:Delta7-sterol 5-desaturase